MFYGNRLVVNSFKDLPESALNQLQRHRDLAVSGQGPVDRVQQLQLGDEDYTITYLPLEEGEKPWESLIVVGVSRRELEPDAADPETGHLWGGGRAPPSSAASSASGSPPVCAARSPTWPRAPGRPP